MDLSGLIEVGQVTTSKTSTSDITSTTTTTTCKDEDRFPATNLIKGGECKSNKGVTTTNTSTVKSGTTTKRERVSSGLILQISKDISYLTPFINLKATTLNGGLSGEEEVTIGLKLNF